tara:strand:- start:17 stop:1156 length:1140 start_codon:yes stop_codon:yes gene_type:complete
MVASQGSILQGVRSPTPDYAGQLMGAMGFNQDMQMSKQQQQMNDQSIRMNDQALQQNEAAMNAPPKTDWEAAQRRAQFYDKAATRLLSVPPEQRQSMVRQWAQNGVFEGLGIPMDQIAKQGLDDQSLQSLQAQVRSVLPEDERQSPAEAQAFAAMTQGMSPEDIEQARRIKLGLAPRAVGSADVTIAQGGMTDDVARSKGVIEDNITRAKEEAKNATTKGKEYFEQLSGVQSNIENYGEALRLVEQEGAGVGAIRGRLPSMKAAAIKLDNLQNRLGLDILNNTTFGALSEKELELVQDTALPNNLPPDQLAGWLRDRMAAQQKMSAILDNAVQFLSVPGNTLADLRAMQNEQRNQPAQTQRGAQSQSPSINDLVNKYAN